LGGEAAARLFVAGVALGVPLAVGLGHWAGAGREAVTLHARVAEAGGWTPADLSVAAGEPLHLRLTSDDVVHGFAVGQIEAPAIDVLPGQMVETTLTFEVPGRYTYYCTRWCGLGHWRMRGVIEVTGEAPATEGASEPPLYVRLGLDPDAPHPASATPTVRPAARRGAALSETIPAAYLASEQYRASAPADTWRALRAEASTRGLSDGEVWDLAAYVWARANPAETRAEGAALYAANCAACHGERGAGDGVLAAALDTHEAMAEMVFGTHTVAPTNFTDASQMLGASPALLQGKLIRGGMGTGMPAWGPVLTEAETWALVGYLYSFVFDD
jgi:mono/diheme cytochrome c family protein/plastocyanin